MTGVGLNTKQDLFVSLIQHKPNKIGCRNMDPKTDEFEFDVVPCKETTEDYSENSLDKFWHRAGWLVGLLVAQSLSSFILQFFESLIQHHPVIVYFLTTLLGSGGNAGSQSTVLVVRKLATGDLRKGDALKFLWDQAKIGFGLATILMVATIARVAVISDITIKEFIAVGFCMFSIVFISCLVGTSIPLLLHFMGVDAAHGSAAIQVSMDLIGVCLTCLVATAVLGKPPPIAT
eukprot:GHVP01053504.1.p1 GENE.GHVP01053504.1~~GHVP01053504.1.p1  ORF type:complete len:233 (+),score=20.93 GHVP01053504.1:35-733(+)